MGCFSSKVMTRSSSFQEELNQRLQRRNKGFHSVLEELLISRNGGDQFLALVCSSNKKLQSGSFTSESSTDIKPSDIHVHPETINTWELMKGLEEEEQQQQQQSPLRVEGSIDISKRSNSFHWPPEYKSMEQSFDGSNGDNRGMTRSRSYHTVQEYDAIVERNRCFKAREARLEDSVTKMKLQTISPTTCNVEEAVKANMTDNSEVDVTDVFASSCSSCASNVMDVVEEETIKGRVMNEKGLKRKAMAKELTSLTIPSTIEFPTIRSHRNWVEVGAHVFSPGAYVTPKFGTFGLPVSMNNESKCNDGFVFDPQMLSAFEEAMQQLEVEEDRVLKQIEENLEEKKDEEEISLHIGE